MLLFLTDAHKRHLQIMSEQPAPAFQDICKVATDYFQNGPSTKLIQETSQKIELSPQSLQNAVEALLKLLIESFKNKLKVDEFSRSSQALGFNEEQRNLLTKIYEEEGKGLGQIEGLLIPPHFHNLEWRFEAQVASRSLLHQLTPLMTVKLQLKNTEIESHSAKEGLNSLSECTKKIPCLQTHILQVDTVGLLHITEILEQALAEGSSRHCRRMQHSNE